MWFFLTRVRVILVNVVFLLKLFNLFEFTVLESCFDFLVLLKAVKFFLHFAFFLKVLEVLLWIPAESNRSFALLRSYWKYCKFYYFYLSFI